MEILLLGTGTSHGVPVIGCDCDVCLSSDPRNKRTRSSAYISVGNTNILIDTSPDFRAQVLRENVRNIDAVLFTHSHADHIMGLDDIRSFNRMSEKPMPCYGDPNTIRVIKKIFDYAFTGIKIRAGIPQMETHELTYSPFKLEDICIIPIPAMHGRMEVYGYRIGSFAYLTDCNYISEDSLGKLIGLDLLVLGVLRPHRHTTHLSLEQGLKIVERLKPARTVLTHTSHRMEYDTVTKTLPANVELGYDGMRFTCESI